MTDPRYYMLEGQPARKVGTRIEVYQGNGRWTEWDDPNDSFAYASQISLSEAQSLMVDWDAEATRRAQGDD